MLCSLVTLFSALSGPWLSPTPVEPLTVPASFIWRTQRVERPHRTDRGRGDEFAEKASCRKFVTQFYAWYVAHSKNGDPLRTALRRWEPNFSSELIQRLKEDRMAAAKSRGEIVGLDFDPVLNSQDQPDKYVTGKVTRTGRLFQVDLFSVDSGKRSDGPAVTPELRHERGHWVFTNFFYRIDGKTDDLLSILKQLKADRKKGR